MTTLQERLDELLPRLRAARSDTQDVEVKDASGGFPRSVLETVSAFANGAGGLIVLGLAEPSFSPTGVDAAGLARDLAAQCESNLQPSLHLDIEICRVDDAPVVVADVPELTAALKPCFVAVKRKPMRAYIRSHDGDRQLTSYEQHALEAAKSQPTDDLRPVQNAGLDDLDAELVAQLLRRIRSTRGPVFREADDHECLRLLGVLSPQPHPNAGSVPESDEPRSETVSLAGLTALGRYPQQHFPRLNVTFVAYATQTAAPLADGTRYLDHQPIEGPIPVMLEEAAAALRRNMRQRGVVVGLYRQDFWDYPLDAVREVLVNALMHRDYHGAALGQPVKLELYPDRLEVTSPGGLFGALDPADLMVEPVTAARNARLSRLLQDVAAPESGRMVCENVGTGLLSVAQSLRAAGMAPPELRHSLIEFKVIFRSHSVLDADATNWLSDLGTTWPGAAEISDRQRLGLAYALRHGSVDNRTYRALTGSESAAASRELADLRERGLLERTDGRRWAAWRLADEVAASAEMPVGTGGTRSGQNGDAQPALPAELRAWPLPLLETADAELTEPESRPARLPPSQRESEVLTALANGAMSSRELADEFGVTPNAVRNWLRRLERAGLVRTTEPGRRSRFQRWQRTDLA